ncbi:uncharacterized protein [Rutidosis leptorrhynchoides]|uniref:uncharacterized protein n=1 Tax=Rutidosis leptorrhynchoides TaxID=125765 RepID=UPI003A998B13
MSQILFNAFDKWDSDDLEDLEFLRAMAEEIDAEEAEEHVNNERVPRSRTYIHRDREQAGEICILELYVDEYLRKPTSSDIARMYSAHEEKHSFKGMLGSIDCMHWQWRNCPVAWKGQYTSGHQKHPTIVLEAVASYDTWIWHAFFGTAGANNDVNVLNQSSLFDDIKNGTAPFAPFTVNADGIYPDWATLIKAYSTPTEEPRIKFKRFQENARKDVERTFGVLQVEDNGFNISWLEEELLNTREANPNFVRNRSTSRDVRDQEIRDRNIHDQLREDLTQHIWDLPPNFRTLNA